MINRQGVIFCVCSTCITVAILVVGFQLAALPAGQAMARAKPVPMESLPDLELGPGIGKVSVIDLVSHYIDNPPAIPQAGGGSNAVKRFSGC